MSFIRPNHAHNHFEEHNGINCHLTFAINDRTDHGRAAGQMLREMLHQLTDGCLDSLVGDATDRPHTLRKTFKLEQTHNGIEFTFKAIFDMKTTLPSRYVEGQLHRLLSNAFSRSLVAHDDLLVNA